MRRVQDRMTEPLVEAQRELFLRGCRALAYPEDPEREGALTDRGSAAGPLR
ncbi:MAG: hypothetical protein QOJ30_6587 [Pseudonocardiales bacterium]|nr:hypothetical protein [Pseudonocardiales bacterium]